MSRIFVSHSSRDNPIAQEVSAWLLAQGHRSVFLDFDPANGIPAGRDWEQELYRNIRASRAVIVLCSEHSMSSRWCFMEMTHARALGKQIFPVRVDDCTIDPLLGESQVVDLRTNRAEGLERLWRGLLAAGLDPAEAFDWDGTRSPYPGLLAFQEEDAAIFFGRDDEIGDGLDLLNKCHRLGQTRFVVIMGGSGSGKSSLVRAGLLPRLRRDTRRWIVVDPFRPREDPATELATVLGRAFDRTGRPRSHESIAARLAEEAGGELVTEQTPRASPEGEGPPPDVAKFLEALALAEANLPAELGQRGSQSLQRLRASAVRARADTASGSGPAAPSHSIDGNPIAALAAELRRGSSNPDAMVLIAIDQFEELLGHPADHPCSRFLDVLKPCLLNPAHPLIVLATMRSDFLNVLQQSPALLDVRYESLSVGPMSPEDIAQVIERPAELEALELETGLVQALVDEARAQDALPLLAFTLRELRERFGLDGRIALTEYRTGLGGMHGAVAKSAEELIAGERLGAEQEAQLRRALLSLVRITEDGTYARRTAAWSELPDSVHPLLEKLVAARLLVSRDEGAGRVLEVAHEALFRSWGRLVGWLKESAEALRLRQEVSAAFKTWEQGGRTGDDLWRGGRVARARELMASGDLPLNADDRTFVDASVRAEEAEMKAAQLRRRRRARFLGAVAVGGLVLSAVAGYSALRARSEKVKADRSALVAEERARQAEISEAQARAAQNFAEHQRVQARMQTAEPDSFQAKALAVLVPKYLAQSKVHADRAAQLEASLAGWRGERGLAPEAPAGRLTLEVLKARSGGSLILHYGPADAPRLMLFDGGLPETFEESLKPRLDALRQQRAAGSPLPIDLVVSSQTDNEYLGGLIDLVKALADSTPPQKDVRIGALWSNAFVPSIAAPDTMLISIQPKARLVLQAKQLGIPINKPFSTVITLPEAGSARVHWDNNLSMTVLGPSLQWLRRFAKGWLHDWKRRSDRKLDPAAFPAEASADDVTLETFADPSLELIPSPIEIPTPEVTGGTDNSYANLGSIVLLIELGGRTILLPADSRGDILIPALAQAGYIDAAGTMEVDVMVAPHGGSDNNVSVDFFRRVKAHHYVFQADGKFGNPEVKTFKMIFDARRGDPRPFTIYLTYRPGEYRKDYPVSDLCALFDKERNAKTPFRVVTPSDGQPSMAIQLLGEIPGLSAGVADAPCRGSI